MNTTSMQTVIDSHKATITEAYLISFPEDEERYESDKIEAEWFSSYLPEGEEPMEPISDIFYPIIGNANQHIEVEDGSDKNSHDVVGIFAISVYWRDTIRNILPDGHDGLIAVFENPCNP